MTFASLIDLTVGASIPSALSHRPCRFLALNHNTVVDVPTLPSPRSKTPFLHPRHSNSARLKSSQPGSTAPEIRTTSFSIIPIYLASQPAIYCASLTLSFMINRGSSSSRLVTTSLYASSRYASFTFPLAKRNHKYRDRYRFQSRSLRLSTYDIIQR
jgi:hypothetical protein